MRVFHGLSNISGIPATMARAERAQGIASTSVCYPNSNHSCAPDIIEPPTMQAPDLIKRYARYADAFDIFVFHFGSSLTHESLGDIPLLKKKGKTVIFYFHGCDIRQSKEVIKKYEFSPCAVCWPPLCSPNRDKAREIALKYADRIWVSTPDLLEFLPGAELFLQPVDLSGVPYIYEGTFTHDSRPIRILHAPSDSHLKGTKYVLAAIDELKSKGFPIELLLLEGVPHHEVINTFKKADLGIDQLLTGAYGVFSVEMLAAGIPVISYLWEEVLPLFPEKPPITVASPLTLCDALVRMIERSDEWKLLSVQGRQYVEQYHDAHKAALRSIEIYRSLWRQAA